ncbi:MAG: SAM-dependent methyltransferase [Eubacterium sp.]|nr:SAM-dependent methyltransferase [Eubacterium sp.]
MVRLSDRMNRIAGMVTPGKVMADIGCDHGLISVYLIEENVCPRVIAMDIGEGPLASAKKSIAEHLGEEADKITLRISDGFKELKSGETEGAIIAGMGGMLIISILENGLHNADTPVITPGYELVLSPQSDIYLVRKFLRENGFLIIDEDMLIEDGKYYNIIKAVYNDVLAESVDKDTEMIYDSFGRILIEKRSPVLLGFLERELGRKETLFCRLSKSTSESSVERLGELREEVTMITGALEMIR